MTTPTTTTTTTDPLNVQIARMLGWRQIAIGYSSKKMCGINPAGKLQAIPAYDSDPAAAFGLMEYVCTFRAVSNGKTMPKVGAVTFTIYNDEEPLVEWSIWRGTNGHAFADTLTAAMATACRDAILALKEAEKS